MSSYSLGSVIELGLMRKTLMGLVLGVLIFIPLDLGFTSLGTKVTISKTSNPGNASSDFSLEPLSFYEEPFQKAILFGFSSPQVPLTVLRTSIAELAKDYRLKGVVILDEAEAIFEDARTQKIIFLKEGERLGELEIRDIKEGSVVLGYYGEEKEMRIE